MPAVADKLYSRPPVERMLRIHEQINGGGFPNANKLAEKLEVTSRTIKRDLDFMKYRLNLPIEYDARRYGFFYTTPVEKFPLIPVTESEIFALTIAHKAIAQYRGTPFERPLQTAFRKLTGLVGDRDSYQIGGLESALSFRPFAPEDTDLEIFELLTRALREHRALKFRYRNLGAERSQQRHVRPCHLACVDNIWYLFAFDVSRDAIRMFNLTRLTDPQLLKETFKPIAFDLDKHLQGGLNAFSGKEDYEVVLLFDRWGADLVRGRRWHRSQEMVELHGGRIRMRLRLNNIHEVERFVLGFGEHVVVERPQNLRDRLHQVSATVAGHYAADTKAPAPAAPATRKPSRRLL